VKLLLLQWEYGDFMLRYWDDDLTPVPATSAHLHGLLEDWNRRYSALALRTPDPGGSADVDAYFNEAKDRLNAEGVRLAVDIEDELGPFCWVAFRALG
jgi:hypothetical protein